MPHPPFKIGIIGSECSHAAVIARTINVEGKFPGFSVEWLWGEDEQSRAHTQAAGAIPKVAERPEDMIGKVDGVVIDHRDGRFHLAVARKFVEAGIPCFIDKPLCCELEEGKEFLAFARARRVPVSSYSILPLQGAFEDLWERFLAGAPWKFIQVTGPGDIHSPYSGVFFHGIHLVEMLCRLVEEQPQGARLIDHGGQASGFVYYASGLLASLHLVKEGSMDYSVSAWNEHGVLTEKVPLGVGCYEPGIECFLRMFRTGEEPIQHSEMLKPVAILAGLRESLETGRRESISC